MYRLVQLLVALLVVLTSTPSGTVDAAVVGSDAATQPVALTTGTDPEPSSSTVPVATDSPIATNDFLPDDPGRDLTDCIGVLERPGCGNENRGGWRQTLVLVAIGIGLVIVFGNVVRGVRRNRR